MNFLKKIFGVSSESNESNEEELKVENEKNFDILKYDGVKALRIGNFGYAVECLTRALEIKEDLETVDYLSQAYYGLGEYSLSYQQLEKMAEAQPENVGIFLRMANVAYVMTDYVVMSAACEKALLVDSRSSEALYLYARACIGMEDTTNAVAMLTKAIDIDADYGEAYLLRGEVYLDSGNLDEADGDAMFLLEKFPDNEETLLLKANVERLRKNSAAAIEYYGRVLDVNPFSKDAYKYRAELRETVGDIEGAKDDRAHLDEILSGEDDGGKQDIEAEVKDKYNNVNPLGL